MKSKKNGKNISAVEILNVSPFGIWLLANEIEYFLDYKEFPFFKDAKIADIFKVEQPHLNHLYWPILDVDLSTEILSAPEKFPLVGRQKKSKKISKAS